MEPDGLIHVTDRGLYCQSADFHIDPWRPVERAIITHAHSDHAASGCAAYLCARRAEGVLRLRVGEGAPIQTLDFGEPLQLGDLQLTFHPAGHILGSAQVRLERAGEVWVVSGDYKTRPDPTCDAFEPVKCHTFITESTYGLPIYRWPDEGTIVADMNAWWRAAQESGRTAVVFAYSLGKAQRVLAAIDQTMGPVAVHGAVKRFNEAYERAGVRLGSWRHASAENAREIKGRGLVIAPPSAAGSTWLRKFAGPEGFSDSLVSGWMLIRGARRRRAVDRGFAISDHADWDGLSESIAATGAQRVGVTHGYADTMVRWLKERGTEAFVVPSRYRGETVEDEAEEEPGAEAGPHEE